MVESRVGQSEEPATVLDPDRAGPPPAPEPTKSPPTGTLARSEQAIDQVEMERVKGIMCPG